MAKIRANGYRAFRSSEVKGQKEKLSIPDFEINTLIIHKNSVAYQKSIKELDLRNKTGISILAVKRGKVVHSNPSANFVLEDHDIIYTLGDHYEATSLTEVFKQL
ncbi:MAG TPA: TrkA C-terminal domain-containing protein [Dysgonamonadaceae bacterium]|nr:TrkA C-terminal domain-containing protein [Dysgonamonadaceae bacterium]